MTTDLGDIDDTPITMDRCVILAVTQMEMVQYNSQGDLDKIARSLQAISWLMLADRLDKDDAVSSGEYVPVEP